MAEVTPDWHLEARAEVWAAAEWYAARSEAAARDFLAEIDRALEQIRSAPVRWPEGVAGTRRFLLRRFPYSVVYRERAGEIQIIAVAHASRRPGYWKRR